MNAGTSAWGNAAKWPDFLGCRGRPFEMERIGASLVRKPLA